MIQMLRFIHAMSGYAPDRSGCFKFISHVRKLFARSILIFIAAIFIIVLAHFIIFPQQTRCILIDYTDFRKEGRLYFNRNTPRHEIDTLRILIQRASQRVADFWGQKQCAPKFIYCRSEEDFKKYGSPYPVPAITHLKLGSYIVISNNGVDIDIISHEISHAELYARTGFYNWSFRIPAWFDEGLAMQNDYRSYYSEDTLKARSGNYRVLPDVKKLKTGKQFNGGPPDQVMLNFMAARHEVKMWYSKSRLNKFVRDINSGKQFEAAFRQ